MTFTFIGMPGCGKSCMGRAISRKLNMRCIDGDRVIEKVTGKRLQEIIDEKGLDGFKKTEEEVLLSINDDNVIISPGGSAVYYDSVMQHFKKLGKIIYIYVGLETIKARLGDFSKRGVAMKKGQTIDDLYYERCALYEKYADITINCDGNAYPRYQRAVIAEIQKALAEK